MNTNLHEARAKPELNPQLSAYEQLKPFKDDPSIYISFTTIEKLGIHPSAPDGGTPLGIYAFPLKDTWAMYKVDQHQGFERYPEISHGKTHIQILKWSGKPKMIDGLDTYTRNHFDKDVKKLKETFEPKVVDDAISEVRTDHPVITPFKELYYVTRNLADTYPNQWNHILRYLGYSVIIDRGLGVIHYDEPCQALFLTSDAVNRIGSIHAKAYDDSSYLKEYDPRGLSIAQMVDIAIDNNRRIQKFEPYIMKDPAEALRYATKAMHAQPWKEAEPYIATDPDSASMYALRILRKRWKIAEPAIKKSTRWDRYKHFYLKDVPDTDI